MSKYRGPDPNPEFIRVGRVDDIPPGAMVQVDVDGREVVVMNLDGTFYALDNQCPHNGGPLDQGRFDSSDGRVTRTDTSPTGRFAVVWQRKSYPYTIKAAFGP